MNEVDKYHMDHAGRGPTGRLRNFAAMNDGKLQQVHNQVRMQNNDWEALGKIEMVLRAKQLWNDGLAGQKQAPPDVDQDVWDALGFLAG